LESRIAQICAETLGFEEVRVHDDFFDLGGHSLLVVRLAARLGEGLRRPIPMNLVFQFPTVAMMAHQLRSHADARSLLETDPKSALSLKRPLFCIGVGSSLAKALGIRPAYLFDAQLSTAWTSAPNLSPEVSMTQRFLGREVFPECVS
jgi:acyl carrier protein